MEFGEIVYIPCIIPASRVGVKDWRIATIFHLVFRPPILHPYNPIHRFHHHGNDCRGFRSPGFHQSPALPIAIVRAKHLGMSLLIKNYVVSQMLCPYPTNRNICHHGNECRRLIREFVPPFVDGMINSHRRGEARGIFPKCSIFFLPRPYKSKPTNPLRLDLTLRHCVLNHFPYTAFFI